MKMRNTWLAVAVLSLVLASSFVVDGAFADKPASLATGSLAQSVQAANQNEDVADIISNRSDIAAGAYYLETRGAETCVLAAKNSKLVEVAKIDGANMQRWWLEVGKDGYAQVKNGKTGKVLTVSGGKAVASAAVVQATQRLPKNAAATSAQLKKQNLSQKWVVKKQGDDYMLVSALNKKYVLSAESGSICLQRRAKSADQLFSFTKVKPTQAEPGERTIDDGVYLISMGKKAKYDVIIAGNMKKNGSNSRMSSFKASQRITFRFQYDMNGYYTITNTLSGKKLAPAASCSVAGVNVAQYNLSDNASRAKWRIDKIGKSYRLVNKATGLALQVEDVNKLASANVSLAKVSKAAAQRFSLVRPSSLKASASAVKGVKYISMAANKNCVIGSKNDLRLQGANTVIRHKANTNMQRFFIEPAGAGTYYLRNVATERVVSLSKATTKTNVNVSMLWQDGGLYQKWKIVYNDDFTYAFVNAYSGAHLHVNGAGTAQNTNVKAAKGNSSSVAQKFKLYKTKKRTDEAVALNVPCYFQNPELPTGCESVALTNLLRYWKFDISKTEIADDWMPYGSDGVYDFIGNPYNSSGWIICAPGIANTANSFINGHGAKLHADVLKGYSLKYLRRYIDRGEPLVVWTTIDMGYPGTVQWWNDGYPLRSNNHAVVLSGYDPNTGDYYVSDSLAGTVWRDGGWFEDLYDAMGSQAVVIYRS